MRSFLIVAAAALFTASAAFAEGVEVTNEALVEVKTTDDSGKEQIKYVTAERVVPGSVILYLITYTNTGDAPAEDIVLRSPIHPDLTYVEGSAEIDGAAVHYSVDGGQTFANRDELTITEADGTVRPAEAGDLTDIRWRVERPLASKKKSAVSFRATVD